MPGTFTYTKATNTVVVTNGTAGSPSDFASFVTADRAGSVTLLAAWAPNSNTKALTYQITPVEKLALLISFVVASKTAEADYIFITGTDAWDNAQTESLDVSAGNGTYTTTKRFRTITNIDCSDNAAGGGTVWADGTVAVTQPQWGVIWDYGGRQYQLDAKLDIGDGSTSTYFSSKSESITWSNGILNGHWQYILQTKANATCVFGELVNAANKSTKSGCYIRVLETGYRFKFETTGGILYIYSSFIDFKNGNRENVYANRLWNSIGNYIIVQSLDCYNVTIFDTSWAFAGTPTSIDKITAFNTQRIFIYVYGLTISNLYSPDLSVETQYFNAGTANIHTYYIDCDLNLWLFSWGASADHRTQMAYRQYTVNIHISDKDGANLSGATVLCQDKDGNTIFSVDTGADGKIAKQTINYIRYYYDGGATSYTYSPHKFTISKAGYETLVLDAITVSKPIVWHLELLPILAEADVRLATAFGESKTGTLDLPSINDVEKGVQFDGLTKTGTFKRPPQADVRLGEQYGANDIEFTGLLDLPAIADVRDGIFFDGLTKEGILDLPSVNDVEKSVQFDNLTKIGTFKAPDEADVRKPVGYGANDTEFEGTYEPPIPDYPVEEDVEEGVNYDSGAKTGRFHVPAEEDVEVGVGYGADGIEFLGEYLGLRGDNLTAELERSVDLVGYLENKVELTGELKS